MKLVTFSDDAGTRAGVLLESSVVDLGRALRGAAPDVQAIIDRGADGLRSALELVASGRHRIAREQIRLLAPIPRPQRNILCVGKNYHEHAKEFHHSGFDASAGKEAIPELPIIFTKWPNSVIGPDAPIPSALDHTNSVDYEGELAVVIGPGGRGIRKADAFRHVFGYTIVNDVTARTLQQQHRQWFIGKSLDGFCPMGPAIVTVDEVPDVGSLQLRTHVNGELRQSAGVDQLIFDIPTLIETISRYMTLEPGDIIATGTCAGVGLSFTPPRFLRPGDRVAVTIEPIGTLQNLVM